ncbi:MAG: 4-(cytidine 5'-diphospho)-2-C-methyl-D-erythritol kinase, partial [Spirochaetia bacterium]
MADLSSINESRSPRGRIEAPAKINLHLDVGLSREDGFHSIVSLFSMVDLKDDITVKVLNHRDGECVIDGPFTFSSEENLICKAYRAFAEASGFKRGIHVKVIKRIPDQGGLGGGSSNAAAVLKLLQVLSNNPLDLSELYKTALKTGSDVPFFLSGPVSLVEGRGEILTPIDVREDIEKYIVLLIFPPMGVSTAEAYGRLDNLRREDTQKSVGGRGGKLSREHIISGYLHEDPEDWPFYNSFSRVL